MPEIGVNVEGEGGEGQEDGAEKANPQDPASEPTETDSAAPPPGASPTAEADIADRAAAMLEGLQSGASLNKDGSLSVRRRRESADTERQRRRNRRNQATTSTSTAKSDEGGLMSPNTIPEEGEGDVSLLDDGPSTPVTVVHPPSPEQKGRELPTPPPEGE
jgi:cytokinesis protein